MPTITSLHARQILDSRGMPTLEAECILSDGSFGRAAVPSGASTGSHEAMELRDGDKKVYLGKSVLRAVVNVNDPIAKALKGMEAGDQGKIDKAMIGLDGTENKSKLGANAILSVSLAVARARAVSEKLSLWKSLAQQFPPNPNPNPNPTLLPVPMMNVINGGAHADSGLSFQECMIVPAGFSNFSDALRASAEVFQALKKILKDLGHVIAVGDEGGFAPHVKNADEALSLLVKAIAAAGYDGKVKIALDCAASEFFLDGIYRVDGRQFTAEQLADYYGELMKKFPIVSIEDSHSEDDWEGFALMQKKFGASIQLVGDDIFVTNTKRIERGIIEKTANAVLIKVNQIGTLTETVDAIQMTQKAGWNAVVSHRSGETEDSFIADLAVGLRTGQIKTGSLSRSERICKYNQLLRIEEELGNKATFVSPYKR